MIAKKRVSSSVPGRPRFRLIARRRWRCASELNLLKPYYSFKSVRDKCIRYKNPSAAGYISRREWKQACDEEGKHRERVRCVGIVSGWRLNEWHREQISAIGRTAKATVTLKERPAINFTRAQKEAKSKQPGAHPGSIVATMGFISPLVVRPTSSASLATAYNVHRQYKLSDAFS